MDVRAAVAVAAGKPLEITTVQLEGPREGEVLVEIKATGVCHTDEFTLSGADPEGLFPAILGHEGAGVVGRGSVTVMQIELLWHVPKIHRILVGQVLNMAWIAGRPRPRSASRPERSLVERIDPVETARRRAVIQPIVATPLIKDRSG